MNNTAATPVVTAAVEQDPYAELASLLRQRSKRDAPDCQCYETAAKMVEAFAATHPPRGIRSLCQSCANWFRYEPGVESADHCFACLSQNKDPERAGLRQRYLEAERKHASAEGECEDLRAEMAALDRYKRLAEDRGRTIQILAEPLRRYGSDDNWNAQKKIATDALIAAGMEETT